MTAHGEDESAGALKAGLFEHLRHHLPEYMVPTTIVVLDRLPLTPNHKVDIHALPAPRTRNESEFTAARDELERAVAEVWRTALDLGQVDVEDDFFRLGGNSLLLIRILVTLRKTFGFDLPVAAFLANPTVAGVAALIRAASGSASDSGAVSMAATGKVR